MTLVQQEPKAIYIGRVQVWPTVQTFDFKTYGDLGWTGYSIGYWTPGYEVNEWFKIGSSSSQAYQGDVIPPSSVYGGTLKKIKIWFYRPSVWGAWTATAVWIEAYQSGNAWLEYWRNHANNSGWWVGIGNNWIQCEDLTGECTMEVILETNWNVTFKLNEIYVYDLWHYASGFTDARDNEELWIELGRRASNPLYVRKVEITTE